MLLLAPFGLNLVAAFLHRFPYGGHMRLTMHLTPSLAILTAVGATALLNRLARKQVQERLTRSVAVVMAGLLLLAAALTARDFWQPGKEQKEIRNRDFAAWFWPSMERDHEVVCLPTDLKLTFPAEHCPWENCISPQFVCNQRIYSPRLSRGRSCDFGRVSVRRPLLLVQYWSHQAPYDQAAFDRWLEWQKQRYDLVARHDYPMLQDNDGDRVPEPPDRVEVCEFVPRESPLITESAMCHDRQSPRRSLP